MKPMQIVIAILAVIVLIAISVGVAAMGGYNQAIALDEAVKSQWSQVENQLQRRYDLIPNVVESVKGIAGQEQKVFLGIAEARKAYFQANGVAEKAEAAGGVERALSRLLMLQEAYPELKSNEAFLKLQDTVEGTENRLSVERGRYNETVQTLNQYTRQFPGRLWASLAGVHEATYFKPDEEAKERPKVDFSDSTSRPKSRPRNLPRNRPGAEPAQEPAAADAPK